MIINIDLDMENKSDMVILKDVLNDYMINCMSVINKGKVTLYYVNIIIDLEIDMEMEINDLDSELN